MAGTHVIPSDTRIDGEVAATTGRFSTGTHGEDKFDSDTKRALATRQIHEHKIDYRLPDGADVASFDIVFTTILQDCELIELVCTPEVAPTGGLKKFTVDVHKGDDVNAYATMLSTPLEISVAGSAANRKMQAATVNASLKDCVRGQTLKLIVIASGATGSQGQGGVITAKLREHPDA